MTVSTDRKIKVALIDNMNNNFFALARYLRDKNIDAHLFVVPGSSEHFHPQADTHLNVSEVDWIHNFPFRSTIYDWVRSYFSSALESLNTYDVIIACGMSPAYLFKYGIGVDLFIPYGSDLYSLPFADQKTGSFTKDYLLKLVAKWQTRAIQASAITITNTSHALYKKALDRMGVSAKNIAVPMLYFEENNESSMWDFLEEHDFIVFNHSRQLWFSNPDSLPDFEEFRGNKRNDKVVRAFAEFLCITKFKKPVLVLFEYGVDVARTKELIAQLKIEGNVRWVPKSPRREILKGLKKADIAVDQLREGLCGIGGTTYEILCSGTVAVSHTQGALADKTHAFYGAPIVDVLSIEELLSVFIDFEHHPEKFAEIAQKSQNWFIENLGSYLTDKYVSIISNIYESKKNHLNMLCSENFG